MALLFQDDPEGAFIMVRDNPIFCLQNILRSESLGKHCSGIPFPVQTIPFTKQITLKCTAHTAVELIHIRMFAVKSFGEIKIYY